MLFERSHKKVGSGILTSIVLAIVGLLAMSSYYPSETKRINGKRVTLSYAFFQKYCEDLVIREDNKLADDVSLDRQKIVSLTRRVETNPGEGIYVCYGQDTTFVGTYTEQPSYYMDRPDTFFIGSGNLDSIINSEFGRTETEPLLGISTTDSAFEYAEGLVTTYLPSFKK